MSQGVIAIDVHLCRQPECVGAYSWLCIATLLIDLALCSPASPVQPKFWPCHGRFARRPYSASLIFPSSIARIGASAGSSASSVFQRRAAAGLSPAAKDAAPR